MNPRGSKALSFIVLGGTSIYALIRCIKGEDLHPVPLVSYSIIIVHSLMGTLRYIRKEIPPKVDATYQISQLFQKCVSLPLLVTYVHMCYGFPYLEIAGCFLFSAWPVVEHFKEGHVSKDGMNFVLGANIGSLALVSCMNRNCCGLTAAFVYLINRVAFDVDQVSVENPKVDTYNFGLTLFVYYINRAIELIVYDVKK